RKIAIVTSPSGAVIRDIITTVSRRYPIVQLVLFPALVQGNEAANSIAAQIKMINTLDDFDTIIIGRGGGSIEDLWPFNEEVVARAIFASKLPVISSVGHETDTTIADLVADMRAATPTAAAELATPVLTDILEELQKLQLQTIVAFRNILKMRSQQVQHLQQSYIFQEPQRLYEGYVQNVDILTEKLISLEKQQITTAEGSFKTLNSRLLANTPASRIKMAKQNVEHLRQMTNNNITNRFSKYANDLNSLIGSLDTLSPLKIMSRGYTYVTRDTKVVKSIEDLSIDDKIQLNFSDGSANAVIKTINSEDK
ncbi:exodeoxyribonuclease VII large subunit, partial [Pediococcus pentosaceus]